MVGNEGAQAIRKALLSLSIASNTGIDYWEKKSLINLRPWMEALKKEGAEE